MAGSRSSVCSLMTSCIRGPPLSQNNGLLSSMDVCCWRLQSMTTPLTMSPMVSNLADLPPPPSRNRSMSSVLMCFLCLLAIHQASLVGAVDLVLVPRRATGVCVHERDRVVLLDLVQQVQDLDDVVRVGQLPGLRGGQPLGPPEDQALLRLLVPGDRGHPGMTVCYPVSYTHLRAHETPEHLV